MTDYYGTDEGCKLVVEGIRIGTMLGKKLKVRNESRDTKWTRKDSGRIDKRLIAELGFGNDRVFSSVFTDSYADAHLHISIEWEVHPIQKWVIPKSFIVLSLISEMN